MKIKDFSIQNKPRERLKNFGVKALSDAELLAIILQVGGNGFSVIDLSNKVINEFGKDLFNKNLSELMNIKGIGFAKACKILSVNELSKRFVKNYSFINNADEARTYSSKIIGGLEQEHFLVIHLGARNQVLGHEIVTKGLVDSSLVHSREVFRSAIKNNAVGIILAHNHPSGCLKFSEEDERVTKILREAGELLGIKVLDHIVV